MRYKAVLLTYVFLLPGCATNLGNYQSVVSDLKNQAVAKLGVNHDYKTSLLVGARSVWRGKTCLDFMTNNVDFKEDNSFALLEMGSVEEAIRNALKRCEAKVQGICIPVIVNDECQLDSKEQGANLTPSSLNQVQLPPAVPTRVDLQSAKEKCLDIGFINGTEEFGRCVLKISK